MKQECRGNIIEELQEEDYFAFGGASSRKRLEYGSDETDYQEGEGYFEVA